MSRLTLVWSKLDKESRLAAIAALGLFVSMFLPWYQQNAVVNQLKTAPLQSRNLDAFQVFSFVEAAVLLVAVALLYMLFARAEGREFNMPGGDGSIVLAGGGWSALLLVFRLFDKPGISTHGVAGNVGVQWGIFFALAASGTVAYAGSRMRATHQHPARRRRRETVAAEPAPQAEGPPPTRTPQTRPVPDEESRTTVVTAPPRAPEATKGRPRFPPTPAEQLSFEDPTEHPG